MAAIATSAETKGKQARIRGRLPDKKSINMALVGQKKTKISTAVLLIILILAAAAALAKFGVMDRLDAVNAAQLKVRNLRTELSDANAKLESFGELREKYAHYTQADMSKEELRRVERSDVVELLERVVLPVAALNEWSVNKNQLTFKVTMDTLQDTNLLIQSLNDEELVDFATMKSAVTNEIKNSPASASSGRGSQAGTSGEPGEETAEEAASEEAAESPEETGSPDGAAEEAEDGGAEGEEGAESKETPYTVTAQILVYLASKEG